MAAADTLGDKLAAASLKALACTHRRELAAASDDVLLAVVDAMRARCPAVVDQLFVDVLAAPHAAATAFNLAALEIAQAGADRLKQK